MAAPPRSSTRSATGPASSSTASSPAETEAALVQRLKSMGYAPVSIEQANAGLQKELTIPGFGNKVKLKDLAIFSRQFATMINSGLSLMRALTILAEQTENPELAETLAEVRNEVEAGSALSVGDGQAPEGLPAADGQPLQGRRGRRLPRRGAAADRGELRGRGQAAREDQVRDDLSRSSSAASRSSR